MYVHEHAEVVELVDTLGSGSSAGNGMGVRVSPSAPKYNQKDLKKVRKVKKVADFLFV